MKGVVHTMRHKLPSRARALSGALARISAERANNSVRLAYRHPEITISFKAGNRDPVCKTAFSIPVSETKIRARRVDERTSSTGLIGYRGSSCEYRSASTRRSMQRETSILQGRNEKATSVHCTFHREDLLYASTIIDIGARDLERDSAKVLARETTKGGFAN